MSHDWYLIRSIFELVECHEYIWSEHREVPAKKTLLIEGLYIIISIPNRAEGRDCKMLVIWSMIGTWLGLFLNLLSVMNVNYILMLWKDKVYVSNNHLTFGGDTNLMFRCGKDESCKEQRPNMYNIIRLLIGNMFLFKNIWHMCHLLFICHCLQFFHDTFNVVNHYRPQSQTCLNSLF